MFIAKLAGRTLIAAAALLSVIAVADAQQPGTRIRGQIEKADGNMLTLKTREGATLQVHIADDTRISALEKASLKDVKNDTFIGIAGMPRPDGSIEAFSIHIFLPAQRGVVPDRTGPWDTRPGSTMTNAYVESSVASADGDTLKVKYKDGEKTVHVSPQTAIAAAAKGDKSELKAGAQIIIFGWDKQPDGSILAKTLYVGRGLTPAM
jgi:hypothetical protein